MKLPPGSRVCDRNRSDEAPIAVVIEHMDTPANRVEISSTGRTVAHFNREYDPSDSTVVVMFPSRLDELLCDRWRAWGADEFEEQLAVYRDEFYATDEGYAYPLTRLMYCGQPGIELDDARQHAQRNIVNIEIGRAAARSNM